MDFLKGTSALKGGGAPTCYFPQNCIKMKKIGPRELAIMTRKMLGINTIMYNYLNDLTKRKNSKSHIVITYVYSVIPTRNM